MNVVLEIALAFLFGYFVAAVPLGLLIVKAIAGTDIRRYGTGNIGASNVLRNLGIFPAAVVALGVFLQGLIPPLVMCLLGDSEAAVAASAVGAVVGYGWSVFLGFRGGRSVGVATGAAAVIFPSGFILLLLVYALGRLLKQVALAVLLGFIFYAVYVSYFASSTADYVAAFSFLALIAARRLEGASRDLERGAFLPVVANRLLFDHRPGQRLIGSRDE